MVNISIDLDNAWIYEREYSTPASGRYEDLYEQAGPAMLEAFRRRGVKATFYVIGEELGRSSCRDFCLQAVREGHELANHTFSHPADLYRLSYEEKEREIRRCSDAIEELINQPVVGFRAPGYYLDDEIIEILIQQNFQYDSSVLPSFINLLMGAFIALRSGKAPDKVFGRRRFGFVSKNIARIHSRRDPERFLYEIPISSLPFVRTPVHSTFIFLLGDRYFDLLRWFFRQPNRDWVYMFHAVDTLDEAPFPELREKVAAFKWPLERRLKLFDDILASFEGQPFLTGRETAKVAAARGVGRSALLSLPIPPLAARKSDML